MHIPYGRQLIDESDQQAVTDCLHSAFLTQGPKIEQFADKLKSLTTADYCTLFNSATSALHASCAALGLGKVTYFDFTNFIRQFELLYIATLLLTLLILM